MADKAETTVILSIFLKGHRRKVCDIEMTEKKLGEFYEDMSKDDFIIIGPVSFYTSDYDHGEVKYVD